MINVSKNLYIISIKKYIVLNLNLLKIYSQKLKKIGVIICMKN